MKKKKDKKTKKVKKAKKKSKYSLYGIELDYNYYTKDYAPEHGAFLRDYYVRRSGYTEGKKLKITTEIKGKDFDTRKIYPETRKSFLNKFFPNNKKKDDLEGVFQLSIGNGADHRLYNEYGLVKNGNHYEVYLINSSKEMEVPAYSAGNAFKRMFSDEEKIDYSIFDGTRIGSYYLTKKKRILEYRGLLPTISFKDSGERLPINFLINYEAEVLDVRDPDISDDPENYLEIDFVIDGEKVFGDTSGGCLFKDFDKFPEGRINKIKKGSSNNEKEPGQIKNKDKTSGTGTGFFVSNTGHIITNYHVVGNSDNIKVHYDGNDIKAKVLATDQRLDLALLKVKIKNKNFVKFSSKSLYKSQEILVAGYPFGKAISDDLKITGGIINSLKGAGNDTTRMQIDATINPGNSGGPIVDKLTKNLVGVAVSQLSKTFTKENFGVESENTNYGIKASQVRDFLESNNMEVTINNNKNKIQNIEKSTVFIIRNT